jgi:hypothetical protein
LRRLIAREARQEGKAGRKQALRDFAVLVEQLIFAFAPWIVLRVDLCEENRTSARGQASQEAARTARRKGNRHELQLTSNDEQKVVVA